MLSAKYTIPLLLPFIFFSAYNFYAGYKYRVLSCLHLAAAVAGERYIYRFVLMRYDMREREGESISVFLKKRKEKSRKRNNVLLGRKQKQTKSEKEKTEAATL